MEIPYTPPGTILCGVINNTKPLAMIKAPTRIRRYALNHFTEKSFSLDTNAISEGYLKIIFRNRPAKVLSLAKATKEIILILYYPAWHWQTMH
jgi:hypothetical protein